MTLLRSFSRVSLAPPSPARSEGNPLVHKLQGLAGLDVSDIAALEQISAQARLIEAHVDLIPEDAVSEDAFVVLDGFACRYKQRSNGARQITDYLLPGDLYDAETGALGPFDHAVGTLSPCLVARIPSYALAQLKLRPAVAQALRVARRIEAATTRAWIVNIGCRTALERAAHLFCELMMRLEAVGLAKQGLCPLPLTQMDLAQTLGLSNVHMNRTLQELRRQRLIELKGKSLTLMDLPRLHDIAEFSPAYLQSGSRRIGHAMT